MIKTESILLSSEVSRDGTQFSIKALEDALMLGAVVGRPSCLGHDMTQPIGWNTPFALYFEPHLCRLAGRGLIAEDDRDQKIISDAFKSSLIQRYTEDCEPYLEIFKKHLDKSYSGKQRFLSSTMVSCFDDNIVERIFPRVFTNVDKDGLVFLDDLLKQFTYLGHGVFKDKNSELAICAHSYFRKSLSIHNNLNYYFLDQFLSFQGNKDITLRLRIDKDLIGIAETFVPAMEFEYWHGPKFTDDIPAIKNEVTVHGMDEYNRMFNGIERTEFYRKIESEQQTFEIEEVKFKPSLGISSDNFGCRYCHSQFDIKTKQFKHFDGAIRMYDSVKMADRSVKNIKTAGKESLYTKIFRIDGQLPLKDWQALIYNYFHGNHLIEEYFTGKPYIPSVLMNEQKDDATTDSMSLFPFEFTPEDGVRLALSYTSAVDMDFGDFTHFLIGYDEIDGRKVVEADIIEVKKQLAKFGYSLEIPSQVEYIDSQGTTVWNIPEVLLKDDINIGSYIDSFLKSIENILLSEKCYFSNISLNFKWKMNADLIAGISIVGHKDPIINWLKENQPFPYEHSKLRDWLEIQHEKLSKFTSQIESPKVFEILYPDGVFYIKRESINKFIVADTFKLEKDGTVKFEIKEEFVKLFENNSEKVGIGHVLLIKKSTCSKCGNDYFACEHSRITDNVKQEIQDFEIVGFCWAKEV